MCPAVLAGAFAVLLLPGWMVTYCEFEAAESVTRFHNEPTCAHSASCQTEVCACAATLSSAARKMEAIVFMGSPFSPLIRSPRAACPRQRVVSGEGSGNAQLLHSVVLLPSHHHVVEPRLDDAARSGIRGVETQADGLPGPGVETHRAPRPRSRDIAR